jgi:hypothetical protein
MDIGTPYRLEIPRVRSSDRPIDHPLRPSDGSAHPQRNTGNELFSVSFQQGRGDGLSPQVWEL